MWDKIINISYAVNTNVRLCMIEVAFDFGIWQMFDSIWQMKTKPNIYERKYSYQFVNYAFWNVICFIKIDKYNYNALKVIKRRNIIIFVMTSVCFDIWSVL